MFCFTLGIFPFLNYRNLWHQKTGVVLFLAISPGEKVSVVWFREAVHSSGGWCLGQFLV